MSYQVQNIRLLPHNSLSGPELQKWQTYTLRFTNKNCGSQGMRTPHPLSSSPALGFRRSVTALRKAGNPPSPSSKGSKVSGPRACAHNSLPRCAVKAVVHMCAGHVGDLAGKSSKVRSYIIKSQVDGPTGKPMQARQKPTRHMWPRHGSS